MKSAVQTASHLFSSFLEDGTLPAEMPALVLCHDFKDQAVNAAVHYMTHLVTDEDIRSKDPELDRLMKDKLRKMIETCGINDGTLRLNQG